VLQPLFRSDDNVPSMGRKVSIDIEYIEIFIAAPQAYEQAILQYLLASVPH